MVHVTRAHVYKNNGTALFLRMWIQEIRQRFGFHSETLPAFKTTCRSKRTGRKNFRWKNTWRPVARVLLLGFLASLASLASLVCLLCWLLWLFGHCGFVGFGGFLALLQHRGIRPTATTKILTPSPEPPSRSLFLKPSCSRSTTAIAAATATAKFASRKPMNIKNTDEDEERLRRARKTHGKQGNSEENAGKPIEKQGKPMEKLGKPMEKLGNQTENK